MKLTKFEREILTKVLENQTIENREFPHWRPAVKCPLPTPVQETEQDSVNPALHENSTLPYQADFNPNTFLTQLQGIFGNEIVPGRTNGLTVENFLRAGFLWAAGKICHAKADAQAIIESWEKKAPYLDYFILPELESFADLFAAEIIGGLKGVGAEYKTRHMMIDPDADPKAVEQYEKTAKKLEDKGFVVRLQGQDMTRPWEGLNITKLGAETIQALEAAEAIPLNEPGPDAQVLKCTNCGGVFHFVTDKFKSDEPPTGEMFKLLPKYQSQGWDKWPADWTGENLICPECGERYPDPNTGLLRLGAIIEVTENIAA